MYAFTERYQIVGLFIKSVQKPLKTDSIATQFVRGELICTNKPHTRNCSTRSLTTHVGFCVLTKRDLPLWPTVCLTCLSTRNHGKRSRNSTLTTGDWLTVNMPVTINCLQPDFHLYVALFRARPFYHSLTYRPCMCRIPKDRIHEINVQW